MVYRFNVVRPLVRSSMYTAGFRPLFYLVIFCFVASRGLYVSSFVTRSALSLFVFGRHVAIMFFAPKRHKIRHCYNYLAPSSRLPAYFLLGGHAAENKQQVVDIQLVHFIYSI